MTMLRGDTLVDGHAPTGTLVRDLLPALPPTGLVLGVLAALLPCVTWLSLGNPDRNAAVLDTPMYLLVCGVVAALGLRIAPRDPWLGLFVLYVALSAWRTHGPDALPTTLMVGIGAVILTTVRRLDAEGRARVVGFLLVVGVLQTVYAVYQARGIDPLWPNSARLVHGTMGNPNHLGSFLALLVPVAPWPIACVLVVGLVLSHSVLAVAAAAVGLYVARVRKAPLWVQGILLGLTPAAALIAFRLKRTGFLPWFDRADLWRMSVVDMAQDWTLPLLGWGPGAWYRRMPAIDLAKKYRGELFAQAHNEYVQAFYELGTLGVLVIVVWLVAHRRTFTRPTPLAGSACALAVLCLGTFPLHLPHVGVPALVLLGCALAEGDPDGS